MLSEALDYAAQGWPVFPLAGKIPRTPNGFKNASTDERTIYEWWRAWPAANIGLAILPGVVVLDIDPRHNGTINLAKLTAEYGSLPRTRTCITGRQDGGCHFYLLHPGGQLTDRHLPEGIDIRVGGKHYVVAPPSIHPDTGKRYQWANDETTSLNALEICPQWLADRLRVRIGPITPPPATQEGGDGSALIEFVATLSEGNRNNGLFWAAMSAVNDGVLDRIRGDLVRAAQHAGLSAFEAESVIASARRRAG